jgi:F-type H+-transporting ATPase subunit epsilon
MADTFQLQVATPERLLVQEDVGEVELPGKDGYMGILSGHAPLLGKLGAGILTYQSSGQKQSLAVDGGFIEIFDNHVRVLADYAEFSTSINVDNARQQLDQAKAQLSKAQTPEDADAALAAAAKAQAQLDAAER